MSTLTLTNVLISIPVSEFLSVIILIHDFMNRSINSFLRTLISVFVSTYVYVYE